MKENKGFTLIELLAVIVILAIIALIATPVIMNIINSSRESAATESAKLIVSQYELAYNQAYLDCGGQNPSLERVRHFFEMDGIEMLKDDYTTTANNQFTCSKTGEVVDKCTITDGFGNSCSVASTGSPAVIGITCTNSKYKDKNNQTRTLSASKAEMQLGTCNAKNDVTPTA